MKYYIYTLKITKNHEEKYYIGKTKELSTRMIDHYNGNRKSTHLVKNYEKIDLESLVKINQEWIEKWVMEGIEESKTSMLENLVAKELMDKKGYDCVRGGCFTREWKNEEKQNSQLKPINEGTARLEDFITSASTEKDTITAFFNKKHQRLNKKMFEGMM